MGRRIRAGRGKISNGNKLGSRSGRPYQGGWWLLLGAVTIRTARPPSAMRSAMEEPTGDAEESASVWREAASHCGRWLDGDDSGLDDLIAVMSPVLWHVVRAYRLDHDQVEDVVQTTWLALVRSRSSIREATAIGGWLTTAARREAWRVTNRSRKVTATDDEGLALRLPHQSSAEELALARDGDARIWAALHQLDERCQRLLRIVAFEHRPDYKVVAEHLDMPVGSIGPTRGRCLSKLKELLLKEGTVDHQWSRDDRPNAALPTASQSNADRKGGQP